MQNENGFGQGLMHSNARKDCEGRNFPEVFSLFTQLFNLTIYRFFYFFELHVQKSFYHISYKKVGQIGNANRTTKNDNAPPKTQEKKQAKWKRGGKLENRRKISQIWN